MSRAFSDLVALSNDRWSPGRDGKTRVVLQVGHCSQSVGAGDLVDPLAGALPEDAYLVVAGCDGACYDAPLVLVTAPSGQRQRFSRVRQDSIGEIVDAAAKEGDAGEANGGEFFDGQRRLTLDSCGEVDGNEIDDYLVHGGYKGLAGALATSPEQVIEEVKSSGLRGRGGAYFPAGVKWKSARAVNKTPRYLVVNSEEGEPGVFKDRHLMEGVPHRVLEGAIIAAYASGCTEGHIYVNAEANLSAQRMERAVEQARERGLLGEDILGSGYGLEVEVRRGAGGYVCGEETTLLNTMEGYRREPRLRPPFPTESGLWAKPTVINNAETLASVPFIMAEGAKAFGEIGTESDKGTKIISLSGSVRRPGVAEVPMGTSLRQIIFDAGGGPPEGQTLTAMAVGGPSSGVFPVSMLDTAIRPGLLHDSGVMLGAGGVIALDDRVDVLDVVRALAAYNAAESCGKCTPCREGTPRMVEAIDRLTSGRGSPGDLDELRSLAEVVGAASLCGLGQAAGGPITSGLHFFGDEFARLAGVIGKTNKDPVYEGDL